MTDTLVRADGVPAADDRPRVVEPRRAGWAAPVALIAGLLGALFAIAVPLLPVRVDHTTVSWPQQGSVQSIYAPLMSYAPIGFDVHVPGSAIEQLGAKGGLVAASMPAGAPDIAHFGFVARVQAATDDQPAKLEVILRDQELFSAPVADIAGGALTVHSDPKITTATLTGSDLAPITLTGDHRPQLTGIFSDLPTADGATVTAQVDSRFTVTPTLVKRASTVLAVLCTLVALFALSRIDALDGRRLGRVIPIRWRRFTLPDLAVVATLVIWHFIGTTSSDDGYQFEMARTSLRSGYMANYFGYFGVPETPVGTPWYDVLARMALVTTASPWMRLLTLLSGVLTWLLLSREVLPRLGVAVRRNKVAVWTGALTFLAVWMPYNNGLRPEPAVATLALLTWVLVEHAVATRRLTPYALAIIAASFALTANPEGAVCIAPLIAGARPAFRAGVARAAESAGAPAGSTGRAGIGRWTWIRSYLTLLAPLAAAGTLVLAIGFAVQPLSAVPEINRVHQAVGPSVKWYNDYISYEYLFMPTVDGSMARRFGIVAMWLGMLVCTFMLLRRGGRIPFTAAGPARRLLGITFGAMLLLSLSPTKFTHHDGVFAGLAGAIGALTAVTVGPKVLKSPRYRALWAAIVALMMAQVWTSINGWWYVSNFGIPWRDKMPSVHGIGFFDAFLALAVVLAGMALWLHMRAPEPGEPQRISPFTWKLLRTPPLTVAALIMILFELGSFAKGAYVQYPAYSLARSNVDAVLGKPCGLAEDVLVETDPSADLLTPLTGNALSTFTGTGKGFVPGGVGDQTPDDDLGTTSSISPVLSPPTIAKSGEQGGTVLPFELNPATTPELGSAGQGPATLTTGWYRLPAPADRDGLLAFAAAGRIRTVDKDGVETPGQSVEIEYGTTDSATSAQPRGRVLPIDIGPAPAWRNLRVAFDQIPADADVIRIVAATTSLDPKQWVALTPPRFPKTTSLQQVVGSNDPVLMDWAVGLQFPCQRPFDHRDGIATIPNWRLMPDRVGAHDTTAWASHSGGGALGWSQDLLQGQTVPTFLKNDPRQDWGELQKLAMIDKTATQARPTVTQDTHHGMWSPGHIITDW